MPKCYWELPSSRGLPGDLHSCLQIKGKLPSREDPFCLEKRRASWLDLMLPFKRRREISCSCRTMSGKKWAIRFASIFQAESLAKKVLDLGAI